MVNDPAFATRRRRRLRNPDAPIYDDGMIGGPVIDVDDDPYDGDRELRKEAHTEMGAFIKAELARVRQRGEYFVETRPARNTGQDDRPSRPPRPAAITPATYRYSRQAEQAAQEEPEYDVDEDIYDNDSVDDGDYSPDTDEYEDQDDPEEGYDDGYGYRDNSYPRQQPRSRNPYGPPPRAYPRPEPRYDPRRSERYPEDAYNQPRRQQLPARRTDRYSDQQPIRRLPAQGSSRPTGPRNSVRPPATKPVPVAPPSQPSLLAPDGSIPRNPCGDFLVVHIAGKRYNIQCQEERREVSAPHHPNMPHLARINDPNANATAFFVWNHERPVADPRGSR